MTFEEMKQSFMICIDNAGPVSDAQLAQWLNEAQMDIAYELGPVVRKPIAAAEGMAYYPAADCLRIVACSLPYRKEADGALVFTQGGSCELFYRKVPAVLHGADPEESSELPAAVHHLLPLFAASRFWEKESEGDSEESMQAAKWMSYYYQGKNMARLRLEQNNWDLAGWQVC